MTKKVDGLVLREFEDWLTKNIDRDNSPEGFIMARDKLNMIKESAV